MKEKTPGATAAYLRRKTRLRPRLGIILGSGFQGVTEHVESAQSVPYKELAGFPAVGVEGHSGELVLGRLGGTKVAVLSGRAHYYEGHSMDEVTFAVRTLAAFGITDLLLTNAAGAIGRGLCPGDLMVITDHINLMGVNPLRGPVAKEMPRFVDMTAAYSAELRRVLELAARTMRIRLKAGVYLAVGGPSYETPAEIRAFARLGADAVGMSTVPETIVARQCGLRVAGVSCITNFAAGLTGEPLAHTDVLRTGERVRLKAAQLLVEFARRYERER